jgi:hypothetical protein
MGDEAMRRFMKGDGDDYWDHPDGRQVEHIRQAAVLRGRTKRRQRKHAEPQMTMKREREHLAQVPQ